MIGNLKRHWPFAKPNVVGVRSQANYKEKELIARKADPAGRVLRASLNACAQPYHLGSSIHRQLCYPL